MDTITKTQSALLIIFISVLYVLFRFWGITESCLWFDEIFSIHAADHEWSELVPFIAKDIIHPPLFYVLLKSWIAIGGESLFWLRSLPVAFSALSIFPLWLLCRELKLRQVTIITAIALLAVNGALIKYAQEVRMYSLLLFFSLTSVWLFSRYFFRGKSFWMLVFVNILLVYTHYFGWLVVGTEVLIIAVAQRIKIVRTLLMLGVTALAFIPWVIALWRFAEPGATLQQNIGWMQRPGLRTLFQFAFDLFDPFYYQQSSLDPAANYAIVVPMILTVAAAKVLFVYKPKAEPFQERFFFLSAFAVIPVFLAFAISWILPFSLWGSRHLLIAFAPVTMLTAIYLTEVVPFSLRRAFGAVILTLIAAAFVVQIRSEPPKNIWCAWEQLAREIPVDKPQTVYVFEDLIAYHFWFTTPSEQTLQIVKVDGMPEMTEDTAYFLPRGFDSVTRITPEQINGEKFWVAFRDMEWNERHPPLNYLLQSGFKIGKPRVIDVNGLKAYLVRVER